MKVCIAEKPSVAREIATILGANSKREGIMRETAMLLPILLDICAPY
jgi:DNA topoisomerase IA